MRVLRIRLFQPHSHYRIPFTFTRRYTYPIPPYSTVIGFLCNFLGIVKQDDKRFSVIKEGLYLAIYGNFDSVTKEYNWFRNLNKEAHQSRFGALDLRQINNEVEHPGGQVPVESFVLENVRLILYVFHKNQEVIDDIYRKIANSNNLAGTLHLGRAEDLVIFDESQDSLKEGSVESLKIIEVNEYKKPFYTKLEYFTWIPDPFRGCEHIDDSLYDERFSKIFPKIGGNIHLISSLYKIERGIRIFKYVPVKLFEKGSIPFYFGKPVDFLIDEELKIPLFFCKMIFPGDVRNGRL